jgi:RHS repeat-associated protein
VKRKTAQENVEYVLDDRFVLQEASGSDSTHPSYRRYYYGKEPLAVLDSGQSVRFLSVDALGSVSDFTTTSGTLYQSRQYDAWGQYRNGTAPAANQPKLGYTGHQFDPETGLVYARARYYDAETGVFLSRDTYEGDLSDAPSLHRYLYVRGNPLRYADPDGNSDTAADAARRWEEQRAEYRKWLVTQLRPDDSVAKRTGLALTTLSVELGAGMMDLFKLGEGAGEGGWRGWGKDALRAISLGLMLKGTAKMNKEPAPQENGPAPAQAKVVNEPAGPAGDAGGTPASPEPVPGRPAWGSVGAARAGDPFDPEPATPPSSPSRPAAPEPGCAPAGGVDPILRDTVLSVDPAVVGESRLVGANRAVIDPRKLTDYALNPSHPVGGNKAVVFERLGFTRANAEDLMSQLRTGVMENVPVPGKVDQFGARFTVDIPVVGPRASGVVRTGWIYKAGSSTPELTTLFVK